MDGNQKIKPYWLKVQFGESSKELFESNRRNTSLIMLLILTLSCIVIYLFKKGLIILIHNRLFRKLNWMLKLLNKLFVRSTKNQSPVSFLTFKDVSHKQRK